MSAVTANGAPVESMRLVLPARGVWTAELELDAPEPPAVGDRIVIEAGTVRLVGTATRPGADGNGKVKVAVSGGAAKLTQVLEPKNYGPCTVEQVLRELLTIAGEVPSATIATDVRTRSLPRWGRLRVNGKASLDALADEIGATWRVLDDGTVWMGTDAGDEPDFDYDVVDERPDKDILEIALEGLNLRPGQTFRGGPVARAVYELSGTRLAANAFRSAVPPKDRKTDAKIEKGLAPTKWHPPQAAKVIAQRSDGTLDLAIEVPSGKPADVAPLERVPIRHGIPGVTDLKLTEGTRVALFFEGGDPKKPFAGLFIGGRIESLVVDGERFELGGSEAVAIASKVEARLQALEIWSGTQSPPGPGGGAPIASESLFAR